ncbi:TRAP transporter small permease [Dethiobacter alkaliphilus]|uniref:TRAP transporter small permease n=1 Tax=Dethiobacter alkaliphilus TaxID=427926 RepID=UPI002227FE6D|nr:TRAP transporter small permease [Dethiobacter alkaliphilus]MCW3489416.1 TRAP transporter small permease [Dethiobacter alkaliphilus]
MLQLLNRFEKQVLKVESVAAVLLAVVMIVVIFSQVVSRNVLNQSLQWSEELGRYAFVWLSFIGASLALERGAHLGIDTVVEFLPAKIQKFLKLFTYVILFIFMIFMITNGLELVSRTGLQRSPAMRISMSYAYMAIPVGGVLMAFHSIIKVLNIIANFFNPESEGESV